MVTGGGPTIHPELLKELCVIGKKYDHTITIETEGSEFVQKKFDCISLSPKLSNSTPRPYLDDLRIVKLQKKINNNTRSGDVTTML